MNTDNYFSAKVQYRRELVNDKKIEATKKSIIEATVKLHAKDTDTTLLLRYDKLIQSNVANLSHYYWCKVSYVRWHRIGLIK